MKTLSTSPFIKTRVEGMEEKNKLAKKYIKEKNFSALGDLAEREALEMHAIMITQNPPLIYFQPNTILMMKLVQKWRREGLECYFTINTGQDVHILVERKNSNPLITQLKQVPEVRNIIVNSPADGARLATKHLF
jgi:diphosphomevalonate decarboxylase